MGRGQVWRNKPRGLPAERGTQPALTALCSTKSNPRCRQITHLHRANEEAFLGARRLWSGGGHEEEDGTSGSSTMESETLGEGDSPIKKKRKAHRRYPNIMINTHSLSFSSSAFDQGVQPAYVYLVPCSYCGPFPPRLSPTLLAGRDFIHLCILSIYPLPGT